MTIATNETQAFYQQVFLPPGQIVSISPVKHISNWDIFYGKHLSLFDSMLLQISYSIHLFKKFRPFKKTINAIQKEFRSTIIVPEYVMCKSTK